MTTGRNTACECGSGRRYKHCHGQLAASNPPDSTMDRHLQSTLRSFYASELVRKTQQGHGGKIISTMVGEQRILSVGKRVFWSKDWRTFPDFLIHYLRSTLDVGWNAEPKPTTASHPLTQWIQNVRLTPLASTVPDLAATRSRYYVYVSRLAYALYLLERNAHLPKSLIARLGNAEDFLPAFVETICASAFALAGFKIDVAEVGRSEKSTPEFYATSLSGKRYAVEAKRRRTWRSPFAVESEEFRREFRAWLLGKLIKCCRKGLDNPVFWIELSLPGAINESEWLSITLWTRDVLREAEHAVVERGLARTAAYVVVTNSVHVDAGSDLLGDFAYLHGFLLQKPWFNESTDLETAFDLYDEHRDLFWVLRCMGEVQSFPETFDGSPACLEDGASSLGSRLRLGSRMRISDHSGVQRDGEIVDVASTGGSAVLVLKEADGSHAVVSAKLTEQEELAAKAYGDAVFGKPAGPRRLPSDPISLYDQVLETYAAFDREALLKHVSNHPLLSEYSGMPLADLRVRVSREICKAMYAQGQARP